MGGQGSEIITSAITGGVDWSSRINHRASMIGTLFVIMMWIWLSGGGMPAPTGRMKGI